VGQPLKDILTDILISENIQGAAVDELGAAVSRRL